ncbi:MAG: 50S ribosomal protein L29 [Bacteroidia bacterium]|jgi:large subunit ribosomal protein L29|nr:50S ribosomal protein L29 [Bacteroidia bacterium]MCF8427812.1 50S ribosomal protein L29 [Bacteroidia bacterium]MCF8446050.1 50S ribosomal protein L29 [Bacteroidia bacterium]
MKNSEIKELSNKELAGRIREERAGLNKMVLNHAISPVENPNIIKENKKLIARLLTEQRSRQLANVQ